MLKCRRQIGIILTIAITLVIFSSCANNKAVTNDENGKFVPKKQLDLTVWDTQGTDYVAKELDENIVEDWLVEKAKVKVTSIYGNGGGQWDTMLTKLVAGDNLPDVVHCGSGQGPAHFSKLDQLGKVWELTPEMIQKYAPEVWKRTPAKYWERIKINGKILGIPYNFPTSRESLANLTDEEFDLVSKTKIVPKNTVTSSSSGVIWIRDDILKKFFPKAKSYNELVALFKEKGRPIGEELLDIPIDSTEEFIQFMYDIKNANIKEGEKTVYSFGYTGGDNWEALSWLGADMYGYKGHNYTGTWNDVKQKIDIPLTGELIKQSARTQNQMINDNVIDPESLANNMTQFQKKVLNGQYAMVLISLLGDPTSINQQLEDAGKSFRFRPFITKVPAQEEYHQYNMESLWNDSLCLLNTLSEEEVHQVLNWINVQYTDEYEQVKNWGPKDAGLYKETEDGKREFTDPRFTKYYLEGDLSALKPEETKGIYGPTVAGYRIGGLFGVEPTMYSRWTPAILLKHESYIPTITSGFKFPISSSYVTNVKVYPECQVWSPAYAEIPECVKFWGAREQWESQFKLALAAQPGTFNEKWSQALAELNRIVDVSEMERKMTEIAKRLADQIKAGN